MTDTGERLPTWRRGWWPPFLAGAATGLLAGVLLRRGAEPPDPAKQGTGGDEDWRRRWRETWDAAVDGASEGLAVARELVGGGPLQLDAAVLQGRVAEMACAGDCRIRLLGDGIVEVVGSCDSEDDARALLAALAAEPGVEVVVNRVWTPASAGPVDGGR